MKTAILGAFIFLMAVVTLFYCVVEGITLGLFVTPFLVSILLVPYGLGAFEND